LLQYSPRDTGLHLGWLLFCASPNIGYLVEERKSLEFSLLVHLEAKPGKEDAVQDLLTRAVALVNQEGDR
jgi:hypothetical protein